MGEEPVPAETRWKLPGRQFWSRVAQVVIIILILVCLVFIYFLGMQVRYESEATKFVAQGKYLDAADCYLKAHDEARWGHDRLLYLVGMQFFNAGEHGRAMDFFVRLNAEFKDSQFTILAEPYVIRVMEKMNPETYLEIIKTNTRLGEARAHLRASYKRVLQALKDNKAGISNQLTIEFDAYKKYDAAYRQQLRDAYRAVAGGVHPAQLDNPNGAP